MTSAKVGEIPFTVELAIEFIKRGSSDPDTLLRARETLNDWAGENEFRLNHIAAQIEPIRGDSGIRRTRPETPTTSGRNECIRSPRIG